MVNDRPALEKGAEGAPSRHISNYEILPPGSPGEKLAYALYQELLRVGITDEGEWQSLTEGQKWVYRLVSERLILDGSLVEQVRAELKIPR